MAVLTGVLVVFSPRNIYLRFGTIAAVIAGAVTRSQPAVVQY